MQHGFLEEDRYFIREVLHPANEHECLADDDSNMMPLWFDGDSMPKVLIDNDYLFN